MKSRWHKINRSGLSTLCEKDPARCKWTYDDGLVNCSACLKAMGAKS